MSVHHPHTWCPRRLEGGIRSLGIVAIDGCEPPCRLWEVNPRPLENQQVPLTTELSISPAPLRLLFKSREDGQTGGTWRAPESRVETHTDTSVLGAEAARVGGH